MKVTVAFGDVKVVVPCGHGDITIRKLSELAVTRYLKSIQQRNHSNTMTVDVTALVLASDFGILDWDDNVCDVVDDRELIISRFQTNISLHNNIIEHISNVGGTLTTGNSNCNVINSTTDSVVSYNLITNSETGTFTTDSNENRFRAHKRINGPFIPVSTDSYTYNWDVPSTNHGRLTEKKQYQKGKYSIHKRFSVDTISSSLCPSLPFSIEPVIQTSSISEIPLQKTMQKSTKSHQPNSLSLTYFNYPHSISLSTDSDVAKKSPLMSEIIHAPSSLSSSLPSNTDAKSMPQSNYSSMDSTAVSDNINSSTHDCQLDELPDPLTVITANQSDINDYDRRIFITRNNPESAVTTSSEYSSQTDKLTENLADMLDNVIVPVHYDLSDIQEEDISIRSKSNQTHNTFTPDLLPNASPNPSANVISPNLQLPPPMPPLRSEFTKLSHNPLNTVFHPLNSNTVSNSDYHLDVEEVTVVKLRPKTELTKKISEVNISKSDHSIPSLFDSEVHMVDDLDNEWSVSERSADLESMAATTETSLYTTTTATNSFNTPSRDKDSLVVTLKKSSNGFGFSLTSRQNAVDLNNPVYVSKVLENGPAIFDGRMKAGDRILMINDDDVRHLTQKNIKDLLLNIPVEESVKIILGRPSSDAIANILGSSNTSTIQKKNLIPKVLNHTGDKVNDGCNHISLEEQLQGSFAICTCVHKQTLLCCKLNLFHFIILQRVAMSDYLLPKSIDQFVSDTLPKSLDVKSEPPAIQLHHQNKLSTDLLPTKQSTNLKHPNATLGISVRKDISQMSFNDLCSMCHNTCQSHSGTEFSTTKTNVESLDNFTIFGNVDESTKIFCPSCHGHLSLQNGVFVKEIIMGGAAHVDGRLVNGDEIIAVQGICLYNGEEFLPPNNKVILGDYYEPLKCAQILTPFQNKINTLDSSKLNTDIVNMPDPVALLKQILYHAQCTSNSVSIVVLRRSQEKQLSSINTLASVDANYRHNVTVAADVHTQYKKEDVRVKPFDFVKPQLVNSNVRPDMLSLNRAERFEDIHIKDNRQRFYRRDSDNSLEHNTSTNLICLDSEHESGDQDADNNSNHNKPPNNHATLAESYNVSSGILEDVPIIDDRVFSLANLDNSLPSSSTILNTFIEDDRHFTNPLYFSREDNTRQSFSLKRIHLNPSTSSRMSRLSIFKEGETSNVQVNKTRNCDRLKRPKSEVILSRVDEETSNSDIDETDNFEDCVKTIDRRFTLKRRSVIRNRGHRKSLL